MATFYSTGPVLLWAGPQIRFPTQYPSSSSQAIQFLGTAEQTPQAEIRRQYQPAYNDLSGAVPFDMNFLGEDLIFAIDLTRWNESVYGILSTAPQQMGSIPAAGGIPLRGSYSALNGMGTLQAHEGNTITLYAVFPYGFPASAPGLAMRSQGMPVGYRIHGCNLINDKLHQMGSKYRKLHLTFQAAPIMAAGYGFTLYDHVITSALLTPPL